MIKNAFKPQNQLFTGCTLITLVVVIITIGLFIQVASDAWRIEQSFNHKRDELRKHYALWQDQAITDYNITYTNCNNTFCCQNARMIVRDGVLYSMEPDCTNQASGGYNYYYSDEMARSMDDLYTWAEQQFEWNTDWDSFEISYHPEYHYITALEWSGNSWSVPVSLAYSDFAPQGE